MNFSGETSNIQYRTWMLVILRIVLALVALQSFASSAFAADKLQADLILQGLRARNESPIPVEVKFKWDSTRILEGQLEMEFREGQHVLGRYRTGDLALTSGEQKFRFLLPPSLKPFSDSQVEVQMKFVSGKNVFELEPSTISVPTASERSLVVAWCGAGGENTPSSGLERNLILERFAPDPEKVSGKLLTTGLTRLQPEDLPAQPLGYTSFDIVVLTADSFKALHERQLDALARWVKGGGSVCVFVSGGLQPHHVSFLNELTDAGPTPTFIADEAGNLLTPQKKNLRLHSGLGRSVIVLNPDLEPAEYRGIAMFLWKMRRSQMQAVTETGHWFAPGSSPEMSLPYNPLLRNGNPPRSFVPHSYGETFFSVQTSATGGELMNELMPKTVRLIPFSAMLVMLVIFLLMIGPADYFVLGFFKRRRYTWILFPATSLAFMAATILMADHYLGLHDQRHALIVVDLGKDGTALRWNRYELVFAARDKYAETEFKDALWSPLDAQMIFHGGYNPNNPYIRYNGRYSGGVYESSEAAPVLYDGVLPVHFRTGENLRQWRPELNRTFSFEAPPVPLLKNWPAIEDAWPDLQKIRAALSQQKKFSTDVLAISSRNSIAAGSASTGIFSAFILQQLCVGDSQGLFSLVSQISPSGGGNFEDAPAMDAEANDSALLIAQRVGEDIVVYRRIFHGD